MTLVAQMRAIHMTTHLALQVSLVGAQVGVQYVKEEPTMTSRWTFQSYEDKLDLMSSWIGYKPWRGPLIIRTFFIIRG